MVVLKFFLICLLVSLLFIEIFGYNIVNIASSSYYSQKSKVKSSFAVTDSRKRHLCFSSSDNSDYNDKNDVANSNEKDFQIWSNTKYTEDQINKWYLDIDKALLTVGSKGIAPGQVNSLMDLLQQHVHVRIKVASDKLDSQELAKEMSNSELLVGKAELLQVRKRGFMFGTLEKTAAKNTAIRNARIIAIEKDKDISKIKCYNCGMIGHYSSDCPSPKKIETKIFKSKSNTKSSNTRPKY